MGHPDDLSPAERDQYLNTYGPGKIAKGEIPKQVEPWREASAWWRTNNLYGYTVSRGVAEVFGLEKAGWTPEVPHTTDTGKSIKVDWHLAKAQSPDGRAANIEVKAGAVSKDRDLAQLRGYEDKLKRNERVDLIIREAREGSFSKEAREKIAELSRQYPNRFRVLRMNERVFRRVLEAGTRAVQREQRQQLRDNINRLPTREQEAPERGIESIARDYLAEITQAKEAGRPVGTEQIRFAYEAFRDLSRAELRIELDKADERRKALGLGFHQNRDIERFLELQVRDAHAEKSGPVDAIGHELWERERDNLDKAAREAHREIAQAREQGKTLDLERIQQQHLALGNAYGAIRNSEREMFEELSRGLPDPPKDSPAQSRDDWLRGMQILTNERDERLVERIDGLGDIAKVEQKAREEREAREARERQALDRGVDLGVARVLGLNEGLPLPGQQPTRDETPSHHQRMANERARAEERERDRQRGIERGPS